MLLRLLPLFAALVCCAQTIPPAEYAARREALRKALPDSAIVLFAVRPPADNVDRNGTFQEPNFYYLTGWREPNAALLLCSACPADQQETLFLPKRNARKEIYEGRHVAPGDADASEKTGFPHVLAYEKLEASIANALSHAASFYTLFDGQESNLSRLAPLREIKDARISITRLRLRKSPAELSLLQKAIDASIAAHRTSWNVTKPGLHEYEVAAAMQQTYFALGCERNAYPPIVGSGPNSVILHYNSNRRRMDAGDVLLMDVGGEYSMYAADITRTIPVGPTWSARQREIYNLVLGAQQAVLRMVKPGVMLQDLTKAARDFLNSKGNGPNGKPWGTYLPHGVTHHIGLEVHDPYDPNLPLAEGNVITVEPGLYLPEENIGIRIEDMIVLTKDGARLLTAALPKAADDMERRQKH